MSTRHQPEHLRRLARLRRSPRVRRVPGLRRVPGVHRPRRLLPGRTVVPAALAVVAAMAVAACNPFAESDADPDQVADPTATTLAPGLDELDDDASETRITIGDAAPGEIISLRAAGPTVVEWVDRIDGTIISLDVDDPQATPQVVAEVLVETRGREWGLVDSVMLPDGRRFASWTQPGSGDFDNGNLVVGELVDGRAVSVIWNAGRVTSTGIGGQLDVTADGELILAIGDGTGWADERATRGALATIEPDAGQDQAPTVLRSGLIDPRAFLPLDDGALWLWDRADDGAAPSDDASTERVGRADLGERSDFAVPDPPRREPSAMVALADGRIGVCGEADGVLRAYVSADSADSADSAGAGSLDGGEALLACDHGAAVLDDGTIVTVATVDGAVTLQLRRP